MRTRAGVLSVALLVLSSIWGGAAPASVSAAEPDLPDLVSVSSGSGFACAVRSDASVVCWGANWYGGLGIGTTYDSVIPQVVLLDGGATEVSLGESHACAVMIDGTLRCWGANWSGQIGNQDFGDSVPIPVTVPGLDHVVSVGAGAYHTCAVRDDGTAWCWGYGSNGQLGQPDMDSATSPMQVPGITNAVEVASGDYHTCLRLGSGRVKCFGYFPDTEAYSDNHYTPILITGFDNVVALAGGGSFACGVIADGSVRCFGENWAGQLGDGTQEVRPSAVPVSGIDDAVAVGASSIHACAALTDGTAWCWGRRVDGETGQPPAEDPWMTTVPEHVGGIDGVTSIDGGFAFTCAVASGTGMCWGYNGNGQLGDRTIVSHHVPAPLSWVPDSQAPVASEPSVEIRSGQYLSRDRVRIRVTVPATDDPTGTGIDHLEFRVSPDGGTTWGPIRWHQLSWRKWLPTTGTFTFSVRAVDRVGNVGEWVQMAPLTAHLEQETSASIAYTGTWTTRSRNAFSGDSAVSTTTAGDEATITFTGRSFGLVSREARLAGEFQVYVDGEDAGIVDTHARYRRFQRVVFARTWPTSGEHVIRIVALGTEGRPRVDLDAFVFIE